MTEIDRVKLLDSKSQHESWGALEVQSHTQIWKWTKTFTWLCPSPHGTMTRHSWLSPGLGTWSARCLPSGERLWAPDIDLERSTSSVWLGNAAWQFSGSTPFPPNQWRPENRKPKRKYKWLHSRIWLGTSTFWYERESDWNEMLSCFKQLTTQYTR